MSLGEFTKKLVQAGEPLTARAWNDVLDAIDRVFKFLQASQHTVRVTITNAELQDRLETVRVTASRGPTDRVEAARPVAPSKEHILSQLGTGAWTVTAEAHGYSPATQAVTIEGLGEVAPVQIAMTKAGNFMPDLFGGTLGVGRALLAQAGISVLQLFDFNGTELDPASKNYETLPVFVQWPPPDVALAPGKGARLVIGVPVQADPAVEVPRLTGLTLEEAKKLLESVGLVLGKVTTIQPTIPSTAEQTGYDVQAINF